MITPTIDVDDCQFDYIEAATMGGDVSWHLTGSYRDANGTTIRTNAHCMLYYGPCDEIDLDAIRETIRWQRDYYEALRCLWGYGNTLTEFLLSESTDGDNVKKRKVE